jgi:hypothetical protein
MKKLRQFVVLLPLSPENGLPILPATPTEDDPNPAPVLVDESIFSSPQSEAILIAMGAIAPYNPPNTDKE